MSNIEELYYVSAIENGSKLILNPDDHHLVAESTVKIFVDSYNAVDPVTQIPKRSFHNVGHPIETSIKAFSGMDEVHAQTRDFIKSNLETLENMAEPERQRALGNNYKHHLEAKFGENSEQSRMIAYVDQAALAHDVIYHTDGALTPGLKEYLKDALEPCRLENNVEGLQWSEQGKAKYPMVFERLGMLDGGTGPYQVEPLINNISHPNNEILSLIAGVIKTREAGLGPREELSMMQVVIDTIPFKNQKAQDDIYQDTLTIGQKYTIPLEEVAKTREAGRHFTNGADVRAFVMQGEELPARTAAGEQIMLGFAATENVMTMENNSKIRDRDSAMPYDHAVVGSAWFYTMMSDDVTKGKVAVFHGDEATTVPTLDHGTHLPLKEANELAAKNFKETAQIIEARQVTGFILGTLAAESGDASISIKSLMDNMIAPVLERVDSTAGEIRTEPSAGHLRILNNPDALARVNGKEFYVGVQSDPLAAKLVEAVGMEKIHALSEKIIEKMGKFTPLGKRAENIKEHSAELMEQARDAIGERNLAALTGAVSQSVASAKEAVRGASADRSVSLTRRSFEGASPELIQSIQDLGRQLREENVSQASSPVIRGISPNASGHQAMLRPIEHPTNRKFVDLTKKPERHGGLSPLEKETPSNANPTLGR